MPIPCSAVVILVTEMTVTNVHRIYGTFSSAGHLHLGCIMQKSYPNVAHTISGTKLLVFTEDNYSRHFLSSQFEVVVLNEGYIYVVNRLTDEAFQIPGTEAEFRQFFGGLLSGKTFEELLMAVPQSIDDKEAFLAELWQKGVIL